MEIFSMKKLFGSLKITWPRRIMFAVCIGLYTGIVAMVPAFRDTSFRDISIFFEWWILFGIIIITNSESPMDSALKCFVFFLISQPLVYLIQVPFNDLGFGIFVYYKSWFMWTILTFPMGYIGYICLKKNNWLSLLVLAPMMLLTGLEYFSYACEVTGFFPHHLLSALFCIAVLIIYPLCLLKDSKVKIAGLVLGALLISGGCIWGFTHPATYDTTVLVSSDSGGFTFDDTYKAYFSDERFGTAEIVYESGIEDYMIRTSFHRLGKVDLIVEAPDGTKTTFSLDVARYTYEISGR